ncbi:hypothetical protein B0F90DRAFT_1816995 [Multifurca ochricompacta]|uniref:Uncharacterized protein n=1 Tax=Multifurca ochricompacta TaxID=376703 RepID=A0AAD4QNT8_9AGAM|nr:hypothetical protein B0F90DRAFT_1816995 [Multifurca ochricompacta]
MNTNKEINCQAWVLLCEILALIALASGSFLIVVRISAIWERKKHIMILAASVWSVNVGFWIHYTTQSRSTWSPIGNQCLSLSTYRAQPLSIAIFVTDMILLIIMLVGLWQKGEFQRSSLWNLLWTQGLTWVALAAFADIPMIVVLHLNLNDPWNLMFQTGALIVLVIGSTRMHRTLTNWGAVTEYVSNRPAAFHGTVSTGGMGFRTGATTHTAASLRPAEVAISMGSEQFTLIQAKLDKTLSVV